jgi:flagellar protein FliS
MTASGTNAYLRTKVMTANPAELRLMLFDGAIRFAEQTSAALERKDFEACYTNATRCQAILMELINGLKPEHNPDLCEKLSALYTFMYMHMVKATTERNASLVAEVLRLLRYERETWVMLMDRLAQENNAAQELSETPDAQPVSGPAKHSPTLVGATVSLRG